MRGTPGTRHPLWNHPGIIPAHAGNTPFRTGVHVAVRDHPRACGEHKTTRTLRAVVRGSSPRMRGTPVPHLQGAAGIGIIPAHAGNTQPAETRSGCCRDHPRACGEHAQTKWQGVCGWGSSPRMRGTRVDVHERRRILGIIPAHAGNTYTLPPTYYACRDHPRACGEHETSGGLLTADGGSSPRMRGTQIGYHAL